MGSPRGRLRRTLVAEARRGRTGLAPRPASGPQLRDVPWLVPRGPMRPRLFRAERVMRRLTLPGHDRPALRLPTRGSTASTRPVNTRTRAGARTRARPRPQLTALPGVRYLAQPRGPLPGVRRRRGRQLKRVPRSSGDSAPVTSAALSGTPGSAPAPAVGGALGSASVRRSATDSASARGACRLQLTAWSATGPGSSLRTRPATSPGSDPGPGSRALSPVVLRAPHLTRRSRRSRRHPSRRARRRLPCCTVRRLPRRAAGRGGRGGHHRRLARIRSAHHLETGSHEGPVTDSPALTTATGAISSPTGATSTADTTDTARATTGPPRTTASPAARAAGPATPGVTASATSGAGAGAGAGPDAAASGVPVGARARRLRPGPRPGPPRAGGVPLRRDDRHFQHIRAAAGGPRHLVGLQYAAVPGDDAAHQRLVDGAAAAVRAAYLDADDVSALRGGDHDRRVDTRRRRGRRAARRVHARHVGDEVCQRDRAAVPDPLPLLSAERARRTVRGPARSVRRRPRHRRRPPRPSAPTRS